MKNLLLFVSALLFCNQVNSQKLKAFETINNVSLLGECLLSNETGSYYYGLNFKPFKISNQVITHLDHNFSEIYSFEYPVTKNNKANIGQYRGGELTTKNNFVLLTHDFKLKKMKNIVDVYAWLVNREGALFETKKILTINNPTIFNFNLTYETYVSKDSTKILLLSNISRKKNENVQKHLAVLDENANLIWEKYITLPFLEKQNKDLNVEFDDNSNVYLSGRIYNNSYKQILQEEGDTTSVDYKYFTYKISKDEEEIKSYNIEFKDKVICAISTELSNPNNSSSLSVFGLYKKEITNSYIDGMFQILIDTNTWDTPSVKSFDFDDTNNGNKKSNSTPSGTKVESNNKMNHQFNVEYLKYLEDGSLFIIAEQSFVTWKTITNIKGYSVDQPTFHNDKLFVAKVNPQGQYDWFTSIPKIQISKITDYGGFIVYNHQNKNTISILYSDILENIDLKQGEPLKSALVEPHKFKDLGLVAAQIDLKTGGITKKILFNYEETGGIVITNQCKQVSPTDINLFFICPTSLLFNNPVSTYKIGHLSF